ncbi:unnamed protein product, partial [Closterium sp. NIES-54]
PEFIRPLHQQEPSKGVLFDSRDVKFVEGMMYGGWKKQPDSKVSQQMEQITMQLDLTPSVWEEGEEAAAEGGDGEKVQEAPAGGGDDKETSGIPRKLLDLREEKSSRENLRFLRYHQGGSRRVSL